MGHGMILVKCCAGGGAESYSTQWCVMRTNNVRNLTAAGLMNMKNEVTMSRVCEFVGKEEQRPPTRINSTYFSGA